MHTARELHEMRREEWMTPEQAARHLNCTSTKAFQEIVAKEGVPRHYLSDRLPRYSRSELVLDHSSFGRLGLPGVWCSKKKRSTDEEIHREAERGGEKGSARADSQGHLRRPQASARADAGAGK